VETFANTSTELHSECRIR